MAKYVVAAGGNSNDTNTWSDVSSASAGGDGVPAASDDVVLDSGSGNLTINAAMVCRSLDCDGATAFAGTLTHNASVTVTIGDATAGAGNIALRMSSGMTYTLGSTTSSAFAFISTSATQQTITTAGKICGNITLNGTGGSWILSDTFNQTTSTNATITVTAGSFDTNNQICNIGQFASSGSTRVITLGSSVITCTGGGAGVPWDVSASGLTLDAGTSSVTCTRGTVTISGGGQTYADFTLSGSNTATILDGNTFANLTRTGTAAKTDTLRIFANQTVTGTFTVTGNSATNRVYVASNTKGTARTITAAAVSIDAADFQDITGAGAASWDLSAAANYSGDAGGNSGITFTTPATQTATGTASFTWSTHGWTSRVPLPQDDVVINNSFVAGQTVTMDMPRAGKSISFGCSGSPTFTPSTAWSLFGSLDLTGVGTFGGSSNKTFEGRGAYTVTSAGLTHPGTTILDAPGGSLTLADAATVSTQLTHTNGDLAFSSFSFSGKYSSSNANVRTLDLGSSTITLTGTGTVWTTNAHANLTLNAGTSTIIVSDTSATGKTVQIGTTPFLTYNNLTISGDNVSVTGSGYTLNVLAINNAGLSNGLKLQSGQTVTVSDVTTNASSGNVAILLASSAGSAAIISKASGTVSVDWMSIKDSTATGGADFYAGANSTDVSGNTGWVFTAPPGGFSPYWVQRQHQMLGGGTR